MSQTAVAGSNIRRIALLDLPGGGLRVVAIRHPEFPEEVGYFIPETVGGEASPQSNGVEADDRGLIYLLDRNVGLDILENDR